MAVRYDRQTLGLRRKTGFAAVRYRNFTFVGCPARPEQFERPHPTSVDGTPTLTIRRSTMVSEMRVNW